MENTLLVQMEVVYRMVFTERVIEVFPILYVQEVLAYFIYLILYKIGQDFWDIKY